MSDYTEGCISFAEVLLNCWKEWITVSVIYVFPESSNSMAARELMIRKPEQMPTSNVVSRVDSSLKPKDSFYFSQIIPSPPLPDVSSS